MKPRLPVLVLFFLYLETKRENEFFFFNIYLFKTKQTKLIYIFHKKKLPQHIEKRRLKNSCEKKASKKYRTFTHTNTHIRIYECDQFLTRTSIIIFQLNCFFSLQFFIRLLFSPTASFYTELIA